MGKNKAKKPQKRPRLASSDDEELERSPSAPLDHSSVASPPPSDDEAEAEDVSAFDKKWQTAVRTKEEVLGMWFFHVFND